MTTYGEDFPKPLTSVPELMVEFQKLKADLRHCPVCAWRLKDHKTNPSIRVCDNHGDVFEIYPWLTGFEVKVDTNRGE